MPEKTKVIPIAARQRGPGPGRYLLSSLCGFNSHCATKPRQPAFSLGPRPRIRITDRSPGPCYAVKKGVNRNGVAAPQAPTLAGRHKPAKASGVPGPGAYAPEKSNPRGPRAPAYSMAIRMKSLKGDVNPPPNNYSVPSMLGEPPHRRSAPAYSMTGRSMVGSFMEDMAKTPGPAAHKVNTKSNMPRACAYSLQGRTPMPSDKTQKPGPGAYRPENVIINKREMPAFSMGVKHSEYITPMLIKYADE